jgi:SpoVK/Ycf46/Vps4 family AAA+-type ATPase
MSADLFEEIIELPDPAVKRRYDELVGLDKEKLILIKQTRLLLNPSLLAKWSNEKYGKEINLLKSFRKRPPLFIFSGDVGTGKTSLAETFADAIAREENISAIVYRISLKTRGNGIVGDMTKMISGAFDTLIGEAKKSPIKDKKAKNAIILIIDEADALAQSRESAQMHHEDRAGVNALIRGIDNVSSEHLPVIVVMCTNRLSSIDPAVKRRASKIFNFTRPNEVQRKTIFENALADTDITKAQIKSLVHATGPIHFDYGYTYSDLLQKFLPNILIEFFPDQAIDFDKVIEVAKETIPTPPFMDSSE